MAQEIRKQLQTSKVDTFCLPSDPRHHGEIPLCDTGFPAQLETVRSGIKALGFSISDISHIFITHSHPDHSGNVAPLLRESPKAKVYIHPLGSEDLIDPSIDSARRKQV